MKRTSTTKSPRSLDIDLHEAKVFPVFTLAMLASDWCIFLIVSALFVFGMWLLIGEVRNWSNRQADLYRRPPSGIIKILDSIFRLASGRASTRQSSLRQSTPSISLETEKQSTVEANVTPEKLA